MLTKLFCAPHFVRFSFKIRDLFENYGIEAGGMTPGDYTELVRKDLALWKRTVDQLQITLQ